jgi:hypothetical protein
MMIGSKMAGGSIFVQSETICTRLGLRLKIGSRFRSFVSPASTKWSPPSSLLLGAGAVRVL